MIERLPGIIHGEAFQQEMLRFLPAKALDRTLRKPKFLQHLATELVGLLNELRQAIS